MTHRGPFQTLTFWDSVTRSSSQLYSEATLAIQQFSSTSSPPKSMLLHCERVVPANGDLPNAKSREFLNIPSLYLPASGRHHAWSREQQWWLCRFGRYKGQHGSQGAERRQAPAAALAHRPLQPRARPDRLKPLFPPLHHVSGLLTLSCRQLPTNLVTLRHPNSEY